MELSGRTAIVTGAGRGIGRAIALEFSQQGANVVCCARSKKEIEETGELIRKKGGLALVIPTDVTRKKDVTSMVHETLKKFGQIDVLFNNAGSFQSVGSVWEVDPDLWWHDVNVNLRGAMLCTKAVLPHMMRKNEGIIINMNGGGFDGPFPGGSGYGCSKAGLMRFTDTLAKELEQEGSSVLVFGMGPGLVRTRTSEYVAETQRGRRWLPFAKEMLDKKQDRPPEDCARATVNLIRIARPELNGRIFDVKMDMEKIAQNASQVKDKDLLTIRFRPFMKNPN